ncbi:hypothetical protein ACOMHN_008626 [Nucella lapillus]
MKSAVLLLILLPVALSVPASKRQLMDLDITPASFLQVLKHKVQDTLNTLGSDMSEAHCQDACRGTFTVDHAHLARTVCTHICQSFQRLVDLFGLRPHLKTDISPVEALKTKTVDDNEVLGF